MPKTKTVRVRINPKLTALTSHSDQGFVIRRGETLEVDSSTFERVKRHQQIFGGHRIDEDSRTPGWVPHVHQTIVEVTEDADEASEKEGS